MPFLIATSVLALAALLIVPNGSSLAGGVSPQDPQGERESIRIERPDPDPRGGQAYRLIYLVDVPLEIYWQFKIDFKNTFLTRNKFILEHRYLGGNRGEAITANRYLHAPDLTFRWKTTVFEDEKKLRFVLLNPQQCRHKFHYGLIKAEAYKGQTRVTQEGYFDFFGALIWANFPVPGGMAEFLKYTARWEQKTVKQLEAFYKSRAQSVPSLSYEGFRNYSPR